MMHFSCDYCGKDMTEDGTSRYVLKMEAFAAEPVQLTDDDIADDHIEEMVRLLNEQEDSAEEPQLLPISKKMRFDLCTNCFRKFVNDPLGRDNANKFDFSSN